MLVKHVCQSVEHFVEFKCLCSRWVLGCDVCEFRSSGLIS